MKSKEIEKLIRRYVPAGALLGSNRAKFKAELQELHQIGLQQQVKNSADQVPTNWVDPLLTGDDKALTGEAGKWGCPDIENLLRAIKKRIENCVSHGISRKYAGIT